MVTTGTIKPDGSVQYYGYERMDSRVLDITGGGHIALHHAGGRYWDNGGEHYVSARIEVYVLEDLRPANEDNTWTFTLGRRVVEFHPTPKEACARTMAELKQRGQEIAARLRDRRNAG